MTPPKDFAGTHTRRQALDYGKRGIPHGNAECCADCTRHHCQCVGSPDPVCCERCRSPATIHARAVVAAEEGREYIDHTPHTCE